MISVVFLVAGVAMLALALHPFTTYPLSLWGMARLRPRPVATGPLPQSAALCVCAYNEAAVIRDKALNMLATRRSYPALELLVYVDAGSDATASILDEFAGDIRVVRASQRTGKTVGMNMLAGLTQAECLVFSDANVMFAPDALPHLLTPFADPAVGVVCGHLRYGVGDANVTATTGSLYWRLEEQIKRLESATGSVMGADGSIFAMRRTLHRQPPADLIDDMYVSLAALCEGARIVRVENAMAYEETVSRPAEEFRRKVRIACQAFNVHRTLWPRLRQLPMLDLYKYVSHKLLRWLVFYFLVGGCGALATGLALIGAWWLLAAGVAVATAALAIGQIRSILAAFLGTALGLARSMRGERFQTWNPPTSSRVASTQGVAS